MSPRLTNIPLYLAYWARQAPTAEALCVLGPSPRRYSYAEFADAVAEQAFRLAELGVGPGDRVAVLVNMDERLVVNLMAAASLGAAALPISVDSAPCRDVLRTYSRVRSLKAIALSGRFRRMLADTLGTQPHPSLLSLDGSLRIRTSESQRSEWETLVADRPADAPFYVNHTSGSTTNPKLIEATDAQLLTNAHACVEFFGSGPELRLRSDFVYHQHEAFLRPLVLGGCAVVSPIHQGESHLARECVAGRVSHLMLNPPRAEALAGCATHELNKLRGLLRTIEVGGGLLRNEIACRLAGTSGAVIHVAYGATEASGAALASLPVDTPGEVGLWPLPCYTAWIMDETGTIVSRGCKGELILSGSAVASGYLVAPPGEIRLDKGFFHTKDLAFVRDDGAIKVVGRMDNAVKLLGSRQPLELIEQALHDGFGHYAKVVQCLDIEPDDYVGRRLGTALVALIEPSNDIAHQSLSSRRRLLRRVLRRARLAAYLTVPRYFLFVRSGEVQQEGGKLLRRYARERFPLTLHDWSKSDRARLVPAPILVGDVLRTLRWLREESRALRHPLRQLCRELARIVKRQFRRAEDKHAHG